MASIIVVFFMILSCLNSKQMSNIKAKGEVKMSDSFCAVFKFFLSLRIMTLLFKKQTNKAKGKDYSN